MRPWLTSGGGKLRRRRIFREHGLTGTHYQLHREQPVEEVSRVVNSQPRSLRQCGEALPRVPGEVLVDVVMSRPQKPERWHRDDQAAIRLEKPQGVLKRSLGVLQVFQDVEHQDQAVPFARFETRVEGADVDPVSIGLVVVEKVTARLYAFHCSERR